MKVLMLNGSPHEQGNTFIALNEIGGELTKQGIEWEIVQVGKEPIRGCTGCQACSKIWRCAYDESGVNEFADRAEEADGFIFGSPVHYAAATGAFTSFMDRLFYSSGRKLAFKPGAVITCARRAGTTAALDQMAKYLTINQMPVVPSQYWAMVHGNSHDEVRQDEEGMQTMRQIGRNMAWLLRCIEAGKNAGIELPEQEKRLWTNFIH